jgi:hypothetical protein
MRTIYRNVTVLSQELHAEVLKVHFQKVNTLQRKLYFTAAGLAGLTLVMGIVRRMWIPVAISVLSIIVSVFMATNSYRLTAKRQYAQLLRYEPTARREYVFGPDRFEGIVPTGKVEFRYADIARVIEADRFFLLVFEDMSEQAIEKAGFSKGEVKSFKQFLEERIEAARRTDELEDAVEQEEEAPQTEQEPAPQQEAAEAVAPEPEENGPKDPVEPAKESQG